MAQHTVTMKTILLSCVFVLFALTVAGAPSYSEGDQQKYLSRQQIEEFLRERRSHYSPQYSQQYSPQYVSPCAAASAVKLPVSSVPLPTFAAQPYHGYVQHYAYPVPQYRSGDEQGESELLGFSDMDRATQEHVPMARLGGYATGPVAAVAPALSTLGGQVLTQATSGTALGVFPNANVGGCNVPLLFSCSPNIVPGHVMESQGHGGPVSAGVVDSYRLVDEPAHRDVHDKHDELLTHEHMNLSPVHEPSHAVHQ